MTKEKVQAAIDEAFLDGIKKSFGILVLNLIDKTVEADAMAKFRSGLAVYMQAYQDASAVVAQQFPPE